MKLKWDAKVLLNVYGPMARILEDFEEKDLRVYMSLQIAREVINLKIQSSFMV